MLAALGVFFAMPAARAGDSGTPGLLFSPAAEISRFDAAAKAGSGQVVVRWQTSVELGVDAFRVARQFEDGTLAEIGLIRARGFDEGHAYEISDPSVQLGDRVEYDLFMISNYGEQQVATWEGMIGLAAETPPLKMAAESLSAEALAESAAQQCWIGNGDRVRVWTDGAPADRVRLSLTEEGVYRVTAQELVDAGGWSFSAVTNALATTNLSMNCQGDPVAWLTDGDGLIFHGLPAESRFAPENVYWVGLGPGLSMSTMDAPLPEPSTTNNWFMDTILFQGTTILSRPTYSSLPDAPAPFIGETLLLAEKSWQVDKQLIDPAEGEWTGAVNVNLISYYEVVDSDAHEAEVSVGGVAVGTPAWTGEQFVAWSYPFSSTNLTGETATIKIENTAPDPPADDFTRFQVISHGYTYARRYVAKDEALRCAGGPSNTVATTGFSTNDLVVLDVTTNNLPVVIGPVDIAYDGVSSNWSAAFACGDSNRIYQVCSRSTGTRLPSVRGVRDVDWTSASNAVDYAILIPPEGWMEGFRAPMQELADFRSAQGLVTEVVDVESIYNRFSHGLVDVGAIGQFCAAGRTNWGGRPLSYLLLAADGSLDFKHQVYSAGDNQGWFIPTIISSQRFSGDDGMVSAIDAAIGDVDGDGASDVAIGRIPTGLVQDLQTVVNKTIAYEGAFARTNGVLAKCHAVLSPDWNNTPGTPKYYPFDVALDRLIAPLEAANRIHVPARADPADPSNLVPVKTGILIPEFKAGTGLFHFLGHSNKIRLGYSSSLLYYTDFALNDWHPTIGVIMGCQANVWHWLTTSATFVPVALFEPDGGFVAALAAAGYLLADECEHLAVHMYTAAAEQGILRLGDLLNEGFRRNVMDPLDPNRLSYPDNFNILERMQCLSLVGDPALIVRHDVTAFGTDVQWLVAHGQTNANTDLEDPDADGWLTWREFADDTNPTGNVFQIRAAELAESAGLPTLAFETVSNRQYQIEFASSLLSNDWSAVSWTWTNAVSWEPAETPIAPSGPVATVSVPSYGSATQGFYRVRGSE